VSPVTRLDPTPQGRRPWWRPDATDLAAMVGLCRCPSARDSTLPSAPPDDPATGAGTTALAARLSGVLRMGC
jgi:hypothetical protein